MKDNTQESLLPEKQALLSDAELSKMHLIECSLHYHDLMSYCEYRDKTASAEVLAKPVDYRFLLARWIELGRLCPTILPEEDRAVFQQALALFHCYPQEGS